MLEKRGCYVLEKNIVWQTSKVSYDDRCAVLKQRGLVVWFTGLSGAGKSTIAIEVEKYLNHHQKAVYLLDGDNIRHGINSDLGFTDVDRNENIRRVTEIASLFKDAGIIALVSFITPFEAMRVFAQEKIGQENLVLVYVKADLSACIARDPKGLYKKNIRDFTGISSEYQPPKNPDLTLDTELYSISECAFMVTEYIKSKFGPTV